VTRRGRNKELYISTINNKKLFEAGRIEKDATVVLMLTGTGLKDLDAFRNYSIDVMESDIENIEKDVRSLL